MKKVSLIAALIGQFVCYAQDGATRAQAIPIEIDWLCDLESFQATNKLTWHKFVAISENVSIRLKTEQFGKNIAHIHNISIYEGNSETEKTHDELPFHKPVDQLKINLNASKLTVGEIYYIKLDREAHIGECNKGTCKNYNGSNPANYGLCVEAMNVIIPPDFSDEKPLVSYALEQNKGQLLNSNNLDADEVKFFNDQVNPAVYVTDQHISLSFNKMDEVSNTIKMQRIDLKFINSAADKRLLKAEELEELKNYYLLHNEVGNLDVKSYKRIVMQDVYPKIDLHYYSYEKGMKYYFNVESGGNPNDIILRFDGAHDVVLNENGSLDLVSEHGKIGFERPIVYQINPAGKVVPMPWEGAFEMQANKEVKFKVKNYPHEMPLVIQINQRGGNGYLRGDDNLLWATYYGGPNFDEFNDVDTDQDGNVYFVGSSVGKKFPIAGQIIIDIPSSSRIICGAHQSMGVRKWTTLFGSEYEVGTAIATDKVGNVYITGQSVALSGANKFISQNFGVYNLSPSPNTFQNSYAFIIKFGQFLGDLRWSSLFGEHMNGSIYSGNTICTDKGNNVYIAGSAKRQGSSPIVADQNQYENQENGVTKGFIVKFGAGSNSLHWSTLFGNDGAVINDINIDHKDQLFITRTTTGINTGNFPLVKESPNDYQLAYNGGVSDAFVAKFNNHGKLLWSTFFGGNNKDVGNGIAISGLNDVALVGYTESPWTSFPLKDLGGASHFANNLASGSNRDAFISIFSNPTINTTQYELKYSTYFGGIDLDEFSKVGYTYFGSLIAVGTSYSDNLHNQIQTMDGAYNQWAHASGNYLELTPPSNAMIFATSPNYDHEWSTLFGGKPHSMLSSKTNDLGKGIAIYGSDYFYICGRTKSQTFFPVKDSGEPNAYFQEKNGSQIFAQGNEDDYADGFLAQFDLTKTVLNTKKIAWTKNEINYSLFPNPSSNFVTILSPSEEEQQVAAIKIFDLSGKLIHYVFDPQKNNTTTIELDISMLPVGYYHVLLLTDNGKVNLNLIKKE